MSQKRSKYEAQMGSPMRKLNCSSTLRQDLAAVQNVITEPWSNGQTEGQINRLKTLKRAMYGRAGVELLRARILPFQPSSEHAM